MTDFDTYVLRLLTHDKSMQSPLAYKKERPLLNDIEQSLKKTFEYGGFVRLDVLRPEDSYIKELCMEAQPNQFRIIALTRDEDPKNELLEWWEPGEAGFRGMIRFGDDDWDARTVCHDLGVAQKIFYDLYENGSLSHELMLDLRSQWNPKPK